ncbi:hypothetical protein CPAR01_12426 [Colletotrichum paranaense]|uniref:Uncharacterized protein n=2 Tax=Colletotrichum acutatum species complex TaxID=2707335 RepID=A0AAI9XU76_9PEZI|nr:uncharacterized protein CPAR01_12426 [Colletotrichum paranaense]KAK1463182.1 hypothetical protein CMEL01_13251 [Colletotrichum melonis]KAK1527868.1 hypothetical protein CPAR01_12426 [Colletotrichum paranaense]
MRALSLSHLLVLASWAAFSFCAVLVKNAGEIDDTSRGVSQPMTSPPEKRSVLVEDSLKYDGAEGNDWVAPASSRKSVMYQIHKDSVTEDLASRNDDDDEFAPTETNLYALCMELCRQDYSQGGFVHWDLFASLAAIRPLMAAAKNW